MREAVKCGLCIANEIGEQISGPELFVHPVTNLVELGVISIILEALYILWFSAVVNRTSATREPNCYDRGRFSAGFASAVSLPAIGTIRPRRITYSAVLHRIRREPKLASQTTK